MRTTLSTSIMACIALAAGTPVRAADVTYERLVNPEPQNWLMNHHDYSAQRYSALTAINKSNVGNLRLAFAVALGGTSGNENLTATPLVDDGFMYVPDAWGVVYKIDVRSGKSGDIVWKMDPGQEKIDRNRGVALWGNLVNNSALAIDAANGKIKWFHQYTPNDSMDYDETGTHILLDAKVNGEDRKILSHAGRNGFFYSFDRLNGQFLKASQYVPTVTWTKGIDPKTGKPLDYDPAKDLQSY